MRVQGQFHHKAAQVGGVQDKKEDSAFCSLP